MEVSYFLRVYEELFYCNFLQYSMNTLKKNNGTRNPLVNTSASLPIQLQMYVDSKDFVVQASYKLILFI